MKLEDLEPHKSGRVTRYLAAVPDSDGDRSYELAIAGPPALVQEAFAESDFEVTIRPGGTEEKLKAQLGKLLEPEGDDRGSLDFESANDFLKKPPPDPTASSSVFVSLRPLKPGRTIWGFHLPLVVPTGRSLFFILPWVCTCGAVVVPATGDPDLFLSLNSPTAPTVSRSTLGGTSWDRVSFAGACWPWTHFIPFFRVFGFRTSACAFAAGGFGLP